MLKSNGDRVFDTVLNISMFLFILTTLYPFWYVIILSLSNLNVISAYDIWILPQKFNLFNYKAVFEEPALMNGFKITILRTIIGATSHVFLSGLAAYSLSKPYLLFRRSIMVMILITMYFNGGLVPSYLVLNSLGLVNKFLVFILPHFYSVGTIIVMRTFFTTLPASLEESAKIDGASDIKVFSRIILPLSKPVLATMFLFNAVGHWNDWFAGELFIRDPKLLPLATIMMRILFRSANLFQKATLDASRPLVASPTPEGIRNAAIIVSTIPILLVYPFLQKYFTKGIMIGSIKG